MMQESHRRDGKGRRGSSGCDPAVQSTTVLPWGCALLTGNQHPGLCMSGFAHLWWVVDGFTSQSKQIQVGFFSPPLWLLGQPLQSIMWKLMYCGCPYMYSHDCFPVFINQWHSTSFPALPFNNKPSPGKVVLIKAEELRRNRCPSYALDLLDNNYFVSPKDTSLTYFSGANITNGSCLFTPRLSFWIHTDQIKMLM